MWRKISLPACTLFLVLSALPAGGQELAKPQPVSEEAAPATQEEEIQEEVAEGAANVLEGLISIDPDDEPAVLVLHNRRVITLRSRFSGMTPQERVGRYAEKFRRAVSKREVPDATAEWFTSSVVFTVGDVIIGGITSLDLDPLGDETIAREGNRALEQLNLILGEIREERSLEAFLRALGLASLATLVFGLLLWAVAEIRGRLLKRLLRAGRGGVGVGGVTMVESNKVTVATQRIVDLLVWSARLVFGFIWLSFVLEKFPYTRPWGEQVGTFVAATLKGLAVGILHAIPNIFTVLLVFIVARVMVRLTRLFFDSVEEGRVDLPWVFPETALPTRRIMVIVIWIFAIVAAYPYLPGSGSEALKGMSVFIGLMLSLGGSGVVSQAMSGLVLMYSRALRPGDYVRVGDTEGVVTVLGMMATKIRTIKREEVTIPNMVVLSTSTKNYSRLAGDKGVILHTTVTIGYSVPWRRVHELLIEAAGRTSGLKSEPPPFVNQTALSDFYVEYQLNAFLERPEERLPALAALHASIQDSFHEAGIAIVSPHYVADPAPRTPEEETGSETGSALEP